MASLFCPFVIINLPTPEARKVLLDLLEEFGGLTPTNLRETVFARRARFENAGSLTLLINTTDQEAWERMGRPVFALTIETDEPLATANAMQEFIQGRGFRTILSIDPESALPVGSLHILTTELIPGLAFVVRLPMSQMRGPAPVPVQPQ